jgi:Flp pilus assembly protein TadD
MASLGLTLTRLKQSDQALDQFRRAAELQPTSARYSYVLAVALHTAGHVDEAMSVLKENVVQHPNDRDTLVALIGFNRDAGNFAEALRYAEQLTALTPNDPNLANLIRELRRQAK